MKTILLGEAWAERFIQTLEEIMEEEENWE